ncbi:co-chaperone GroES [candidate division KSB1 bacterium]|nr:co-chaperone GroES [candidate division KSB1 bacterium]
MKKNNKEIKVVGDRVLIVPDIGEDRTQVGLYLPKWAVEKETVQGGRIVEVGPGTPLPSPTDIEEEPWKDKRQEKNYIPPQAQVGDYVIFLRKAAIEIRLDDEPFLICPQAALLVIVRESEEKRVL